MRKQPDFDKRSFVHTIHKAKKSKTHIGYLASNPNPNHSKLPNRPEGQSSAQNADLSNQLLACTRKRKDGQRVCPTTKPSQIVSQSSGQGTVITPSLEPQPTAIPFYPFTSTATSVPSSIPNLPISTTPSPSPPFLPTQQLLGLSSSGR